MYNHKFNTDDVILRNITVGLLDLLNKKIKIKNVISADEVKEVDVPFLYSMTGDQSFLYDFYKGSEDIDCFQIEGNTDPIPRAELWIESITIDAASLTNKFVRGSYVRNEDGEVKTFNSYWLPIPLRLIYSVEVVTDNVLEAFKIIQELIKVFYKVTKYQVAFEGFRIPCAAGFSEDYAIEKLFEFTHEDDEDPKVIFNIEVEAYQPQIDENTERFRGNLMQSGIDPTFFVDQSLTDQIEDQNTKDPDFRGPYGYDEEGNPIKGKNSL